jgi:hypothetical protein
MKRWKCWFAIVGLAILMAYEFHHYTFEAQRRYSGVRGSMMREEVEMVMGRKHDGAGLEYRWQRWAFRKWGKQFIVHVQYGEDGRAIEKAIWEFVPETMSAKPMARESFSEQTVDVR